jgi:hypothetical protein
MFQSLFHRVFQAAFVVVIAIAVLLVPGQTVDAQNWSIGTNFTGSSFSQSGFFPPDTMGAVGPDHIVELINGRYAAYDRTGALQQSSSLDNFWVNAGVTPAGSFSFDPRIVYDQYSSRWFATAVDNAGGANNYLVGVSNSSDPTAGWNAFQIDSDADDSNWADFPMLGLNQDNVVISANMFDLTGSSGTRTGFVVLDKSDLIAGTLTTTTYEDVNPNNTGFTPQPVFDLDNNAGPLKILSSYNKPSGLLKTSTIDSSALNTSGGFINVASRGAPPDIDQPGTKTDVDAGDNRFSGNVVQQNIGRANDSLWGVHGVEVNGRAALEWYEIDAVTDTVIQTGLIDDPSLGLNYASIAVNDFGDVLIGFSGGDPSTFMSTYFVAGQTVGGVTTFDPITLSMAGVADYQRLDGSGRNRWGDYSATVIDPNDPRSFWTFQEFASGTDQWSIQITQVTFVPEPATAGMLGWAAIGFFAMSRRRRSSI